MNNQKISPNWFIITLSIITIFLWLLSPSPLPRFHNFTSISSSIGQLLSLIGIIFLSLNFILSTRLHVIDKYFQGLNKVYKKHSQIGQLALILLLFHPLFLIPKYASNIQQAASFLWFSTNWTINFGIIALLIMIILIKLTLYLRPKYNIWKWTHKFMGLALTFAILHIWYIPSDNS